MNNQGVEENLTLGKGLFARRGSPCKRSTPPFDGVCILRLSVDDNPLLGRFVFEGKDTLVLTASVPFLDEDNICVVPSIDQLDREPGRQNSVGEDYDWNGRWGENEWYDIGNTKVFLVCHRGDDVLARRELVNHVEDNSKAAWLRKATTPAALLSSEDPSTFKVFGRPWTPSIRTMRALSFSTLLDWNRL